MRDIFVRHRATCRYVSPSRKKRKRIPARLIFGCGCPIYARLLIRHRDPNVAPFEFNGSLAKLGVREKLAAEELIDQWTVQFLSGSNGHLDPNTFKTVEQAVEDYLLEKRGTFDPNKESTKLTIQKIAGILKPLPPFLEDRGVVYLRDVKTEHLSAFQETWQGRLGKNRETGHLARQPKSQIGKQKNQEFVKMFFRRARELRWLPENPAELLLAVKTPRIVVKKKTSEEKQRLLEAIPRVFPNIMQTVTAFVLIQRYSATLGGRSHAADRFGSRRRSHDREPGKERTTGFRAVATVRCRAGSQDFAETPRLLFLDGHLDRKDGSQ